MARMILAAFAALCALAAVAGVSVVGEAPQNLQLLAVDTALQALPTDILDIINKTEVALLEKVREFETAAEDSLDSLLQKIEEAEAVASETLKYQIDKATALGANVSECINAADEALEATNDKAAQSLKQCQVNARQTLNDEVQQISGLVPQAKALLQDAVNVVNECRKQVGILELPQCLLEKSAAIQTKIEGLASGVRQLAGAPAAVQSAFASCAQSVTSDAIAQIQAASQTELVCIQDKIRPVAGQ